MSELRPIPLNRLLHRLQREMETGGSVFGLGRRHWYRQDSQLDLCVQHGAQVAGNPLGPAAGPHTQLAQNFVPAWLAGARIFELKTIQVMDNLSIPRPCIHAPDLGLNVEWSQELRLRESLEEYAKAAWLLEILQRSHKDLELPGGKGLKASFDLSVGYDLAGLRSTPMRSALERARHPEAIFEVQLKHLDKSLHSFSGSPPAGSLADTITLSTFHGCPPEEIEGMVRFLMEELGWNVVIKFNPTLLGTDELEQRLHGSMGYREYRLDREGILRDLAFERAIPLLESLQSVARSCGRALGAKFTNTLILKNEADVFPEQHDPHMYLSGLPLHPLALATASQVLGALSDPMPISFSAGLDRRNAGATLACGFSPLTVCTDLLKPGGYARMKPLANSVEQAMRDAGASNLKEFCGHQGMPDSAAWQQMLNRLDERSRLVADQEMYWKDSVRKKRREKRGTLARLDCTNCDLCIQVCPNNAFFQWNSPGQEQGSARKVQYAFLADACNACGNCDTHCPELGDPIDVKERVFLNASAWDQDDQDGICIADGEVWMRFDKCCYVCNTDGSELPDEMPPEHSERARLVLHHLLADRRNPVRAMWEVATQS